ncbi:toll/interleukin-1 receptor domain-containing protein [Burkholderia ubonensis]|uniref:TIR domain-containing protein n=1 Tax=Burkholderia ubonensis subsp. mesacidophila TaxID=265293 RepID=A0A2A4EV56_9BURK|nr:toll/interleukin-1 receptor domain-containing protein [Burkholderia ubonensis]PCE24298.1 hypothetical protein BZL54_33910 [Burkholderia ubonensis subsp. mesacidophila]
MIDPHERFWEDLLLLVEESRVIPVIGPDLVTVYDDGVDLPIGRWIARRLQQVLDLPVAGLPERFQLNDVVSLHLSTGGDREELYPRIFSIVRNAALSPCELLSDLASISRFNLYVSLTCDSLLADALAAAHPGSRADQISYAPNALRDMTCSKAELTRPLVFHLLGRASCSPEFVICDEDLLEFVHAMQDKQRQPAFLFDELRRHHLLFLGCGFQDWLTRFFIRAVRSVELSQKRRRWEVLVDDRIQNEADLTFFLKNYSHETRVVPITAHAFVSELTRRWRELHPVDAHDPPQSSRIPDTVHVPQGAIFISYASENIGAAERLASGLQAAGLDVWFDKAALHAGDDWAHMIRQGVERCSLFAPVISHEALSERNHRRYFWREWNYAHDIASGMSRDETFIVPIVIDDTRIDVADALPDTFKRSQAMRLSGGTLTSESANRLVELVRDFHRRQQAT